MTTVLEIIYQFGTNSAFLLLSALGLIVILGMMNIINLAHGAFMMIGAYIASFAYHAGIPLFFCIIISFAAMGVVGFFLERILMRWFLGHELFALIVTWGITLIVTQGTLLIFGPYLPSIPIPFGSGSVGDFFFSWYQVLLIGIAYLLLVALWTLYHHTSFGLRARATMQEREMARALGVRVGRVYTQIFMLGCALAGLAGALLAPTTTIAPYMGHQYIAPAFITVVIGGTENVIAGVLASTTFLSAIETPFTSFFGTFIGLVGMLLAALILIRFLPNGLSGWIQNRWLS